MSELTEDSTQVVVPLVMNLVHPTSVVDVGCGLGTWLSAFVEAGVERILGIDGVDIVQEELAIPSERFVATDLAFPYTVGEKFDLVVSLEVAEHISPDAAETFIDTLTNLGPVVMFSAAIPHQGGHHHVNEQWPSYWAELFRLRGYQAVDCIRPIIWGDNRVQYWYRQNIILFCKESEPPLTQRLDPHWMHATDSPLSLVHPELYLARTQWPIMGGSSVFRAIRAIVPGFLRRPIRRLLMSGGPEPSGTR